MGIGASAGAAAAVESASAQDLKAAVESMPGDAKQKIADALEYVQGWQEHKAHYAGNELIYASKRSWARVLTLLDEGADVDSTGKFGTTALRSAAEDPVEGNAIAFLLLRRGADANLKDSDGYSPLFMAVDHNNPELVIKLLEYGATSVGDELYLKSKNTYKDLEDGARVPLISLVDMWEQHQSKEEQDAAVSDVRNKKKEEESKKKEESTDAPAAKA